MTPLPEPIGGPNVRALPIDVDDTGAVYQVFSLPGGSDITMRAEDVRRAPTGVHARVVFLHGDNYLLHSVLNVDRDEDRVRFINRVHKKLSTLEQKEFPAPQLQSKFDIFTAMVWKARVAREEGGWEEGADYAPADMLTPHIIKGGGTIAFGPPGGGKTWLGLIVALSVQWGSTVAWDRVQRANVLYVNLERGKVQMRQRVGAVGRALGLPAAEHKLLMLNRRGSSLSDVEDAVVAMVREYRVGLVIVDSLSRAGVGNLNNNDAMNLAMDTMNRISGVGEAWGCSWLLIGHTPREDATHLFGSMMVDAAADIMGQVVYEEVRTVGVKRLGLGLVVTKANDIEVPDMGVIALEFRWEHGDRSTSQLVGIERARAGEFIEVEGSERVPARERIVTHLGQVGEDTVTHIADELALNRVTVSKIVAGDKRITGVRKEGRQVFYGLKAEGEPAPWAV